MMASSRRSFCSSSYCTRSSSAARAPVAELADELLARAEAAGGRIGDTDEYPFMYQRQFDDLDGYHYSPFWMAPQEDAQDA